MTRLSPDPHTRARARQSGARTREEIAKKSRARVYRAKPRARRARDATHARRERATVNTLGIARSIARRDGDGERIGAREV
jgi:hypothetical protein